jgi:hypothetical protein
VPPVSDERARVWKADRDSSVSGGSDGPMPVQTGDVIVVYICKSWSDAAQKIAAIQKAVKP